jgi:hypothetical protein
MVIGDELSRLYMFRPEVFYELGRKAGSDPRIFSTGKFVRPAVPDEQALFVSSSGKLYSVVIDLSFRFQVPDMAGKNGMVKVYS